MQKINLNVINILFVIYKSVVFVLFLAGGRLVAVQAVHSFPGMCAQFVFMHHRILRSGMTLRALARGAYHFGGRLFALNFRSRSIQEQRCKYQAKAITTARNTDRNDMRFSTARKPIRDSDEARGL
jgi:hypothetical protein